MNLGQIRRKFQVLLNKDSRLWINNRPPLIMDLSWHPQQPLQSRENGVFIQHVSRLGEVRATVGVVPIAVVASEDEPSKIPQMLYQVYAHSQGVTLEPEDAPELKVLDPHKSIIFDEVSSIKAPKRKPQESFKEFMKRWKGGD